MILRPALKKRGIIGDRLVPEIKAINAVAYREMAEHFHRENLPRRFTFAGGKMLGFAPRKEKYTRRKQREKKHIDFLKWSGESARQVTAIRDIRVSGTSKTTTAKIVMHARKLNFRNPHSSIRMNDEVRTISPREVGPLVRVLKASMRREIKRRDTTA